MKLVIELSDREYEEIVEKDLFDWIFIKNLLKKGITLQTGHGRLIDADYLKDVILLHNYHGNNKDIVPYSDRKGYRLRQREVEEAIINAPTILNAEKK